MLVLLISRTMQSLYSQVNRMRNLHMFTLYHVVFILTYLWVISLSLQIPHCGQPTSIFIIVFFNKWLQQGTILLLRGCLDLNN